MSQQSALYSTCDSTGICVPFLVTVSARTTAWSRGRSLPFGRGRVRPKSNTGSARPLLRIQMRPMPSGRRHVGSRGRRRIVSKSP